MGTRRKPARAGAGMTGVVVLGQALLSPPEPYMGEDQGDLDYVAQCACGGVETRSSLGVLRCADCGGVIRR